MPLMSRNLRAALLRGEYMKADAGYTFAPLDVPYLRLLQENWDQVRLQLAGDSITKFDVFDGLHFSHEKFERLLIDQGLGSAWPYTEKSGARRLDKETWDTMTGLNPDLEELYTSGAVSGSDYWMYEGKTLDDIRVGKESESDWVTELEAEAAP